MQSRNPDGCFWHPTSRTNFQSRVSPDFALKSRKAYWLPSVASNASFSLPLVFYFLWLELCIKVGRGQGDGDIGTRVWGLGTWGREMTDLRTSSMGRGDVWDADAGTSNTGTQGTRDVNNWLQKSEVNAISVTFLVNMFWWRLPTLPSLGFLHACLRSKDSAKTPCIEESETIALVFLLMEYWSPKLPRRVIWVAIAKNYVE